MLNSEELLGEKVDEWENERKLTIIFLELYRVKFENSVSTKSNYDIQHFKLFLKS